MAKVVGVIMGSQSDLKIVREALEVLREFQVGFDAKVLSAHRSPKELAAYIEEASRKGARVFIAAAGGAAALAGVVAAHTHLPVIGIPMETKSLKGLDSLLSTVQMPAGIPVACMAVGKAGAKNSALFALEILAITDKRLSRKLSAYKNRMRVKIKKSKLKI